MPGVLRCMHGMTRGAPRLWISFLAAALALVIAWLIVGQEPPPASPPPAPHPEPPAAEAPVAQDAPQLRGTQVPRPSAPEKPPTAVTSPAPARVERGPCTLSVIVRTKGGETVSGARVVVLRHDDNTLLAESATSHAGVALIGGLIPARSMRDGYGRVRVEVRDPHWASTQAGENRPSYLLAERATIEIPIVVLDARSVRGTVSDAQGPVEGATVMAMQEPRYMMARGALLALGVRYSRRGPVARSTTDQFGHYELHGLRMDKHHVLVAFSGNHVTAMSSPVRAGEEQREDLDIHLESGVGTRFHVRDARGEPVAGAKVQLICSIKSAPAKWFRFPSRAFVGKLVDIRGTFTTNAQGTAFVGPLPENCGAFYRVDCPGFRSSPIRGDKPALFPRDQQSVEVTLDRGGTIEGVVVDREGLPRVGVDVWGLHWHSEKSEGGGRAGTWVTQQTVTDDDGAFELSGLDPKAMTGLHFARCLPITEGGRNAKRTVSRAKGSIRCAPGWVGLRVQLTDDGEAKRLKR